MTDELITRLAAANPVPHDGPLHVPEPARPRPTWKIALGVVVAIAALAGTGIAIADGLGAFNGIGAAQHQRTASDAIDPATVAFIKTHLNGVELDTARHIGQLPSGNNVYVVADSLSGANLCTVIGPPHGKVTCGDPLSKAHPVTIDTYPVFSNGALKSWITFGIALDGVTSISFQYSTSAAPADGGGPLGPGVTEPVNDNLWIYRSDDAFPPTVLQSVTAHFADGTAVTEPDVGKNCAAC
jgi:hypothetical protein